MLRLLKMILWARLLNKLLGKWVSVFKGVVGDMVDMTEDTLEVAAIIIDMVQGGTVATFLQAEATLDPAMVTMAVMDKTVEGEVYSQAATIMIGTGPGDLGAISSPEEAITTEEEIYSARETTQVAEEEGIFSVVVAIIPEAEEIIFSTEQAVAAMAMEITAVEVTTYSVATIRAITQVEVEITYSETEGDTLVVAVVTIYSVVEVAAWV